MFVNMVDWMDLVGVVMFMGRHKWCCFDHRRRQHQCTRQTLQDILSNLATKRSFDSSSSSSSTTSCKTSSMIPIFLLFFLLLLSSSSSAYSLDTNNQTFRPQEELQKLKAIRARLDKINKPSVRTIQVFISLCFSLCFL